MIHRDSLGNELNIGDYVKNIHPSSMWKCCAITSFVKKPHSVEVVIREIRYKNMVGSFYSHELIKIEKDEVIMMKLKGL
jgi:hypothetical protein